jgi:predicted Zn-dependent peptidase
MLLRHHARHYNAVNSVLCFSGRVTPERCFRLARKYFGAMPRGRRVAAGPRPAAPSAPKFLHVPNVSSQTTLRLAFRAPGDDDPREPAIELLLRVLDDGMSTRLYDRICDSRGLCYDVGALYESYEDDGVFDVAADTAHGRVLDVMREIRTVLEELADKGPTEHELDKAKARHRWQMQAMQDESEALGGFYALAALAEIARTPVIRHEQLLAVTRENVRSVAEHVFSRRGMGIVTVGSLTREQQRVVREEELERRG